LKQIILVYMYAWSVFGFLSYYAIFIRLQSNSGLYVLMSMRVLSDEPEDITQFILGTDLLKTAHVVELFRHRFVSYSNCVFSFCSKDLLLL